MSDRRDCKVQTVGQCKLTGITGRFVKSHIIPRALAKPRSNGDPFAQIGSRHRPTRRRDSWYDPALVVAQGEKILEDHDRWAITELRRLKLIWQSWGPMQALITSDFHQLPDSRYGLRKVDFADPIRMRRFLLSLLWRAAATSLREFDEIIVRSSAMRRLRQIVCNQLEPPDDFFPTTLTQISTLGFPHNLSAIAQNKHIPSVLGSKERNEPIFRFYFDGLAIHFHTRPVAQTMEGLEPMLVGNPNGTVVTTVIFEDSWQRMNLGYCIRDAEHEFPGDLARAEGSRWRDGN